MIKYDYWFTHPSMYRQLEAKMASQYTDKTDLGSD